MSDEKWDRRFLDMAEMVASYSKDPSTKVGAVIVDAKKRVLGLGFNGLPRGVDDNESRLHDRFAKYAITLHAELNAILNAKPPLEGATIYTSPFPPCAQCAAAIIQVGIARVVWPLEAEIPDRWREHFELGLEIMREAGVACDLR